MLIDRAKTHVTKALKSMVLGYRNHRGKSAIRLLRGATDTRTMKVLGEPAECTGGVNDM
jgi:hypothetical protein